MNSTVRRGIAIIGFATAIGLILTVIVTYLIAMMYHGYSILIMTNNHGEWILEIAVFIVSVPFLAYACWDYLKLTYEQDEKVG